MVFDQLSLFSQPSAPLTVSEVTGRIRAAFDREPLFQNLWVEGEVTNYTRANSGHIYFTLKDAGAQIACVVWRTQASGMAYLPASGDQVIVHGRISLYEQGGKYQITVDLIQPAGRGTLYAEFERLKAKLQAEGLFDSERKRALPGFPRRIGIVTSPKAAAYQDVLKVLGRRFPLAELLLSPAAVQGEAAPSQIVAALDALNRLDGVDLVLVVRGGGSIEDLWAFNDERVARAVAASRIPVVSGVGHETDFTLTDFAADVRAPTPSAAAEIATPDIEDLWGSVALLGDRLERAVEAELERSATQLGQLRRALSYLSPSSRVQNARQRVDELMPRLDGAMDRSLDLQRRSLALLVGRLDALNPDAVLGRGYAIVRDRGTGTVVSSVGQTHEGQPLVIRVRDGEACAVVVAETPA